MGYDDAGREVGCFEVTINPHEASRQLYAKVSIEEGKPGHYHIPASEDYGKLWANAFTSDKKQEKDGRIFYGKDSSSVRGEAHDTGKYCLIASIVAIEYGFGYLDDDYIPGEKAPITPPMQNQSIKPLTDSEMADAFG
jgi:hypothetical protein